MTSDETEQTPRSPRINTNNYTENSGTVNTGGGDYVGSVGRDFNRTTSPPPQNLAEAAAEIQKLLEQLERTYSTDTTTGRMQIATDTINCIENSPALAERILSALKAGGSAALESFLDHPAASFAIAALEDWQNSHHNPSDE